MSLPDVALSCARDSGRAAAHRPRPIRTGHEGNLEPDPTTLPVGALQTGPQTSGGRRRVRASVLAKLTYTVGKDPPHARITTGSWPPPWPCATASSTAGSTRRARRTATARKRVYYLSLEFLIGRLLLDALGNLGLTEDRADALARARRRPRPAAPARARRGTRQWRARPPRRLLHGEHGDASASRPTATASATTTACSGRSSTTAGSRRYPEDWLSFGNPWEFARPEIAYRSASAARSTIDDGRRRHGATCWHPAETVDAVAYDTPVVGWRGRHVNTLRLWSARARRSACGSTPSTAATTSARWPTRCAPRRSRKVLYPSDDSAGGAGAAPAAGVLLHLRLAAGPDAAPPAQHGDLASLADQVAIQLNDTHPAIAVAELMRLLVDVHGMAWDEAWRDHAGDLLLHQPHAAARGAGNLAGAADGAAAAAPHADHLPHQRRAPR